MRSPFCKLQPACFFLALAKHCQEVCRRKAWRTCSRRSPVIHPSRSSCPLKRVKFFSDLPLFHAERSNLSMPLLNNKKLPTNRPHIFALSPPLRMCDTTSKETRFGCDERLSGGHVPELCSDQRIGHIFSTPDRAHSPQFCAPRSKRNTV